ncbi:hypothetical protein FMN50_22290 [Rhodobacterales bacterium]|nr:hypothetical protein FMN50_22290 [Rhodobacterales bacterium]
MAINICSHSGSTTMGAFGFIKVSAKVYLQETDVGSGKFQCLVHFKYKGIAKGSGSKTFPVSGDTHQHDNLPHGISIDVKIADWHLTSTDISFKLTASLSGHGMGPDYLFKNTLFGGPLPSAAMPEIEEKIKASLTAAA